MKKPVYTAEDLLRVMTRLRDPVAGCPWDVRQDFRSVVPSTLEECYELAQAIEQEDFGHVAEELGDVLFQVVFYAELGRERDLFSFATIVDSLTAKLVRRHAHVFADGDIEGVVTGSVDVDAVKESWEVIKAGERKAKSLEGLMADVPVALPALPRAQKLQKRATRVNFDWPDADAVLAKLDEEIAELREAMARGTAADIEAEMGDILFTCTNLARHLGLDAESCLRRASARFEQRFMIMEKRAAAADSSLEELSPAALDELWEAAKRVAGGPR